MEMTDRPTAYEFTEETFESYTRGEVTQIAIVGCRLAEDMQTLGLLADTIGRPFPAEFHMLLLHALTEYGRVAGIRLQGKSAE